MGNRNDNAKQVSCDLIIITILATHLIMKEILNTPQTGAAALVISCMWQSEVLGNSIS